MIAALINLIIYLLIFGVLFWLVIYVLDAIPVPQPLNRIIRIVLVVVACLIVILLLLQLVGIGSSGMSLPKII